MNENEAIIRQKGRTSIIADESISSRKNFDLDLRKKTISSIQGRRRNRIRNGKTQELKASRDLTERRRPPLVGGARKLENGVLVLYFIF